MMISSFLKQEWKIVRHISTTSAWHSFSILPNAEMASLPQHVSDNITFRDISGSAAALVADYRTS